MVSAVHTFGFIPVLIVLSVAGSIGVGVRTAMHRRSVKWAMSEQSLAIMWWVTAAIAFAMARVFLAFVFNAAGVVLAVLYIGLGAACVALGRRHWTRQTSQPDH
jgi:uncharacterized membrane protein YhdT